MTLSTNRVVNVAINMSPVAAQKRGFGTLCVLGDSAVMGANEVIRFYNDADSVVGDFVLVLTSLKRRSQRNSP